MLGVTSDKVPNYCNNITFSVTSRVRHYSLENGNIITVFLSQLLKLQMQKGKRRERNSDWSLFGTRYNLPSVIGQSAAVFNKH